MTRRDPFQTMKWQVIGVWLSAGTVLLVTQGVAGMHYHRQISAEQALLPPPPGHLTPEPDPPKPPSSKDRLDEVREALKKYPGVRITKAQEAGEQLTIEGKALPIQGEDIRAALKPFAKKVQFVPDKPEFKDVLEDLLLDAKLTEKVKINWDKNTGCLSIVHVRDEATEDKLAELIDRNRDLLSEANEKKTVQVSFPEKDRTKDVQEAIAKQNLPGVRIFKAVQCGRQLMVTAVALNSQRDEVQKAISALGKQVKLEWNRPPTVNEIAHDLVIVHEKIVISLDPYHFDSKTKDLIFKGKVKSFDQVAPARKILKANIKILAEAAGVDAMDIDVTGLKWPASR